MKKFYIGDLFKDPFSGEAFMLARVTPYKFCLINLRTGNRWMDPVRINTDDFGCDRNSKMRYAVHPYINANGFKQVCMNFTPPTRQWKQVERDRFPQSAKEI